MSDAQPQAVVGCDSPANELDQLRGENAQLKAEVERLRAWKESMLQLEATWNEQEVANLLEIPLGTPIRPNIAPEIKALRARIAQLESGWVRVEERLPELRPSESFRRVLVGWDTHPDWRAVAVYEPKRLLTDEWTPFDVQPTHWRELPPAPETQEDAR